MECFVLPTVACHCLLTHPDVLLAIKCHEIWLYYLARPAMNCKLARAGGLLFVVRVDKTQTTGQLPWLTERGKAVGRLIIGIRIL